ncbi:MAG: DUF4402 domain-containing protein [Pseudomonadota bacterium]
MFLKFFIAAFFVPAFIFAENVTTSMGVYTVLSLSLVTSITVPTVTTLTTGAVTSEQTSSVPGGTDGVNASIDVTGEPSKQYSLSFAATTVITNGVQNLTVNLSMGTGGGNKTGRTLSGGGTDTVYIKGSITFTGTQVRGAYNNNSSPFSVTATYDDV